MQATYRRYIVQIIEHLIKGPAKFLCGYHQTIDYLITVLRIHSVIFHYSHYFITIKASSMLLKKKPTALLIIYNLSLRPKARTRNRNKPLQTIRTMLSGGRLLLYPRITPRLVGRVAAWISNIPTQPQASLISNFSFLFTIPRVYRYWPGRQALLALFLLSEMQQGRQNLSQYGQLYRFGQGWQALERLSF